ncbi:MAG: hypothetical protein KF690_02215 [Bacteroidetes bacterium]|nr:hypothetical protein [Bacteroidota bacterium]
MNKLYHLLPGLLACLLPLAASAQKNNPLSGRDTLVLVSERIETLPASAKPGFTLPKPDVTFDRRGIAFRPDSIAYQPEAKPFEILQAPVPKPLWEKLYNHHIMGGIGAFITPMFRGYFSNGRSTQKHILVLAEHFSTPNGHEDFASFARNRLSVAGKYLLPKVGLASHIHFDHNQYFSYNDTLVRRWQGDPAFMDQLQLERAIRQRFMRLEWQVGAYSLAAADKPYWRADGRLRVLGDRRGNQELQAALLGELAIPLSPSLRFSTDLELAYTGFDRPAEALPGAPDTQVLTQVTPMLSWSHKPFEVKAGVRFAYAGIGDSASVQVYPVLSGSWQLFPFLIPYVDISGRMQQYARWQALADNPWLDSRQVALPWSERLFAQAGVRSNWKRLRSDAAFFIRQAAGMPVFFSPDSAGTWYGQEVAPGHFLLLQERNFTAVGFQLQARAEWNTRAYTGLLVRYQSYSLDNIRHYFQVPNLTLTLDAGYTLARKLALRMAFNVYGERPMGIGTDGQITRKGAFADLNFQAEYLFSRRFSVFCQFNNLLNQEYYRWNGYLERPLDFRLGGTLSF